MIDDRDGTGTDCGPIDGEAYDAWNEAAAKEDEELDEPEPWRCRDPRYFKPPRGRRYVIHPLPTEVQAPAMQRRRRPRMGLRFAVG